MWVCLCKAVTEKQVRLAVRNGARSLPEIALRCRAGTGCGGCAPELCRILDDELARQAYMARAGVTALPRRHLATG
jgi:bacterioferritin-associated ferredoxin